MMQNYLKFGLRTLSKSKTQSFINIFGLTVAISSCIIISLFIIDEMSYDRHHQHADRIHRVVAEDWARMPAALAPELVATYPHMIDKAVRLWPLFSPAKMRHGKNVFVESGILFADTEVFDVFSWELLEGNRTALLKKNSIVITESMAKKYFGSDDPMGKQLGFWGNDLTVTGVMKDIPHNSHLPFDFLISFQTLHTVMGSDLDQNWGMPVFFTYILNRENTSVDQLSTNVSKTLTSNFADKSVQITLQPLADIHLHSNLKAELKPGGNLSYLYILGTAAIFILCLAGANFANLNTARATTRTKEIGMRKILGAVKRQVVQQFFGETLITVAVALALATIIVSLLMPAFNQFTAKDIDLSEALTPQFLAAVVVIMMLIGFVAAFYPVFILYRLKPARLLRGPLSPQDSKVYVRKSLVVFQFLISTFFLTSMMVILLQVNYLERKDLGFDQDQVIVLDGDGFTQLKTALANVAGVDHVSGVPQVVPAQLPLTRFRAEGVIPDSTAMIAQYGVTSDFLETMGIRLIAGRSFQENEQQDPEAFVLNQSAATELGWTPEQAIGKSFAMFVPPADGGAEIWRQGRVVGVVEDFHYDVLYNKVKPLAMYPSLDINLTLVRAQITPDVLASIEKVWKRVNPDAPFNYYLIDDKIQKQYDSENRLGTLMSAATFVAVLIAALGLLGLVSFSANQRTKEIGIRKVLGATTAQVVALLSKDFLRLVLLAAILSLPITHYALSAWLDNFAYHIELSWVIFAGSVTLMLIIALLTVVLQSLSTANTRPTESLKAE